MKLSFRVVALVITKPGETNPPPVPELLKQYVFKSGDNHLVLLAEIMKGLPIKLGEPSWIMEFDAMEHAAALQVIKGRILKPDDNQLVPPNWCMVSGTVEFYNQQPLYLFTGDSKRFWPSARIWPTPEGRWEQRVNLGKSSPTGTIRLVAVDRNMAEYIDMYRRQAGHEQHNGMQIPRFPHVLDSKNVKVDLSNG